MATNSIHNMATLIKRLEAAASRFEDIASSIVPQGNSPQPAAITGASAAAAAPKSGSQPSINLPKTDILPPEIEDYDTLINGDLATFVKLSQVLDPLLAEQASIVHAAFEAERQFILISTKAKKPDMNSSEYVDLLTPLQEKMIATDELRQQHRASPLKDHLALVADGLSTLAWVTTNMKPADYAAELFGGAQMYGNKVLKQYKDKDEAQVEWVKAFYKLMRSLIAYIRQHHPKGIQWNPQGVPSAEAIRQIKSSPTGMSQPPPTPPQGSPSPAGGAPLPPPMPAHLSGGPPPPPPPPATSASRAPAGDIGAVFAELNQGSAITSGLKKVESSQMTHKNPSLRAAVPVPARSSSQSSGKSVGPPGKKPKPESMRTKKPPKKELEGNKWIIENFDSPGEEVVLEVELNHSILITKCKNTIIKVNGKANAITIDSSQKTSIIIESLVSSIDVIKCPSFALQVLGSLPTVLLDQVDGATIYLSRDSLDTEFLTSKCSAVNIYLPPVKEDDDYKECNVPEQFRSVIKSGGLVTEIVEHSG